MRDDGFEQRLLTDAASAMTYPPTPDLRASVAARIDATATPARRGTRPLIAGAIAAAVAAALLVVGLPASRSAIAEFFGLENETIERLPTAAPGTTATPFPTPLAIERYATPSTLEDAAAVVGFDPARIQGAGAPEVYIADYSGPVVVLHYEEYDLWQSRRVSFRKGLPASVVLREFLIGGEPAAWIRGGAHIITFLDDRGTPVAASQRTVTRNTLVWTTEYASYRLETDLSEDEAIAIAEGLP